MALRKKLEDVVPLLKGGLVVSCQPVVGGAMDSPEYVRAYALAAQSSGACALRIEGSTNVKAVAGACRLPIIGLIKRDLPDSPVRITPFLEDVRALAEAGATIVACDATECQRPVPFEALARTAHAMGCLAMADCSCAEDVKRAVESGADLIGTTLSGYTGGAVPREPDLTLVTEAAQYGLPVIAEGRYNSPVLAAQAISCGADAVVVGSAITRPEHVTAWYLEAIKTAYSYREGESLAVDIGGTKTRVALVRGAHVQDAVQVPTVSSLPVDEWFTVVAQTAKKWSARYQRAAAAVSGVVRDGKWYALNPANLPVPAGYPIRKKLEDLLGCPVFAVNDAQAAAWGEFRFGAGQGKDLLYVTLSTGLGGGFVFGGKLISGVTSLAGHIGQIQLSEALSGRTLESFVSGRAIEERARQQGLSCSAKDVFAAMHRGEQWGCSIIQDVASALVFALKNVKLLVDYEVLVLGGSVGLASGMLQKIEQEVQKLPEVCRFQVRPSQLGHDAGILGAVDLSSVAHAGHTP